MVPLRVSVIATAIGLISCSPSSDVSAEYSAPKVWNETFENYVDTTVFLDVTVNEESYDVLGRTFEDERSLGDFVRERAAYDISMYYAPAQILVRSDAAVSRQRFRKALEVIEKNYPCERPDLCFAAYGLGKSFLPPNIAPPPPDVPNP